jgi:hypothetical protein
VNTFESPVTNKKEDGSDDKKISKSNTFRIGKLILMYNIGTLKTAAIVKIAKHGAIQ